MPGPPLFGFDLSSGSGVLPIAVGLGVAVGCGVAAAVLSRGRAHPTGRPEQPEPLDRPEPPPAEPGMAPLWEEHDRSRADRRNSIRREGAPVRVYVTSPVLRGQAQTGWVMDRSTGGLRLALRTALPPGSFIQVRTENAPDTVPWVTLVVRSCKDLGEHFELGCAFEQTPPWNVLLLFG